MALFDDRLEVTSPGMLDKDLTIEKMKAGISKIRNGAIAKIFAYMNMIEAWGTGIPKMFQEAKDYGLLEPELLDMGCDFRVNLYRRDAITDAYGVITPKRVSEPDLPPTTNMARTSANAGTIGTNTGTIAGTIGTNAGTIGTNAGVIHTTQHEPLTDEEKLLSAIRENRTITQKQMSQRTGLSLRTIKRITATLKRNGKIVRIGNNRFGEWQIKD